MNARSIIKGVFELAEENMRGAVFIMKLFTMFTRKKGPTKVQTAVEPMVRELLDEKDNPFNFLNKEIAYSVIVEYVKGFIKREDSAITFQRILTSDEEQEFLWNKIAIRNHLSRELVI